MEISIFFCMGAVLVTAVCVFILWQSSMKQKNEYDNLLNSYRQLEELNLQLRSQRHDYLNQLHVIAGLVEVEEYEELQKYIGPLLLEQQKTGKAIRTRSAAVNALFAAKINEAEKAGIAFYLEVSSALDDLPLPDWDLVRILSNLIDNAMTASGMAENPEVHVQLSEQPDCYRFEIRNNGQRIPEELGEKIFEPCFSTKQEKDHGMGLHIVKLLLNQYGGQLEWTSDDTATIFQIRLKKNEGEK